MVIMNKASISLSAELNDSPPKNSIEYDCICIGTSMIVALEACYQAGKGLSVLMVDKELTFGGAWKTITIDGIEDVENAIHYFLPDDRGIEFLTNYLDFPIEPSKGKYRYFKLFNLGYIKFPYRSWVGSLIHKVLYSGNPKSFSSLLQHIYSTLLTVYAERGERSYYTASGSAEMLAKVKARLDSNDVDIWYQSQIVSIYFNTQTKRVSCQVGDKTVLARSLIFGHGARLPKLESSGGNLVLEEKFHPRPAFHLVVVDQSHSNVLEVIMSSDPLVKYVHDVTRFSSLRDVNIEHKKVFVFGLQADILDHDELTDKLFSKLKEIKIIGKDSRVITSLYSDIILPTICDEDLYSIKDHFGGLVNILRTENFSRGIGYYAQRWSER